MAKPTTTFEWPLYADATLAGLSALIPIIGIDWFFEDYFRRRIPAAVARRQERTLSLAVRYELNRYNSGGCLKSCLLLPLVTGFWVLKKLSKKILYFLSVKEAADQMNFYWHRAFLLDYALAAGHLETTESARMARQAIEQVVELNLSSPVYQLARQITANAHHILRSVFDAVRGKETRLIRQTRTAMDSKWSEFESYLKTLAQQYETIYLDLQAGPVESKEPA